MKRKLPSNAFEYYCGLGPDRSYQAVADHFGTTKQTVTRRAVEENWQGRVAEIERKAREKSDEKAVESIDAMNQRHLKIARTVQAKALEALRSMPITNAMEAVRALDIAVKQERTVRGEPSERTAVNIEDTIKREYERWLSPAEDEEGEEGGDVEAADE